jgi:hypothetical protein
MRADGERKREQSAGFGKRSCIGCAVGEILEETRGSGEILAGERIANWAGGAHLYCWLAVCIAWNILDM